MGFTEFITGFISGSAVQVPLAGPSTASPPSPNKPLRVDEHRDIVLFCPLLLPLLRWLEPEEEKENPSPVPSPSSDPSLIPAGAFAIRRLHSAARDRWPKT